MRRFRIAKSFLPIRYPDFGKLFSSQIISNIGSQFSYIALQFLIFDLTGDISAMATLAIAQAIPMILMGPWAGIIVDKVSRKYSMVFANLFQAFFIFLIPFTSGMNNRELWIYGLAFLNAGASRFFFPARSSSIPSLINDKNDLFAANSLSAGSYQVSTLIGPFLAGIIIGLTNYNLPFFIDSFSFIIAAGFILTIKNPLIAENQSKENPINDLKTGFLYIIKFQPIFYVVAVFTVLMFSGGASLILMVPYLEQEFGLDQQGPREFIYGLITAISSLVGLISALFLSKKNELKKPLSTITITLILAGFMLIGFGVASNLLWLGIFWLGFGTIEVIVAIPLQTLLQETVPDNLRGKIFSFLNISITIGQILGMGIISILASTSIGIRGSLITNGLLLVFSSGFGFFWLKKQNLENKARIRKESFLRNGDILQKS